VRAQAHRVIATVGGDRSTIAKLADHQQPTVYPSRQQIQSP
jgi:hypothetical protein